MKSCLLLTVKTNVRLKTGHHLRSIMMLAAKNTIEELDARIIDFDYHQVEDTEKWTINLFQKTFGVTRRA